MDRFRSITIFCALSLAAGLLTQHFLLSAISLSVWFAIVNWGVFRLDSGIFLTCFPRRRVAGKVSITIDDGPDPQFTSELLQLLERHKVRATFFLIGKQAKRFPHLVQEISLSGHEIASHGYSHAWWLNFCFSSVWACELDRAEKAIGQFMRYKWFRPPFALMSPHLAHAIQAKGYKVILFHARALDFGNRRTQGLAIRILKKIGNGGVVMLHGSLPPACTLLSKQEKLAELDSFLRALRIRKDLELISLEEYMEQ